MISANQINPGTPVVCLENAQFAIVDHMEGSDSIKLQKDDQGQHHFIPLSWVTKVDNKVHISRSGKQAKLEWSTSSTVNPAEVSGARDANMSREPSSRSIDGGAQYEGIKKPSAAEQKKMKVSEDQDPSIPHKGASGRTGDQNKGHTGLNH